MIALLAQTAGWSWIPDNADDILERTVEHLRFTGVAMFWGSLISVALAVVAVRYRRAYGPITTTTGLLFTIPSIALIPILVPFTGIDELTGYLLLTIYTLLILVRNTVAGLDGVPQDVIESARGMGYTDRRMFVEIELPLALPVIVAGLRIATVTTIGLVTITGLIGYGGLGFYIFDGFASNFFMPKLVVGAVGTMLLALAFDALLLGVERALTPWAHRGDA